MVTKREQEKIQNRFQRIILVAFGFGLIIGFSVSKTIENESLEGRLRYSGNQCKHGPNSFRCVKFLSNYDGDTLRVDIHGVPPLFGSNVPVRILGVDTPELRSKDPCEREAALEAKARITEILSKAKNIDLEDVDRGKYFRIVARVVADGVSVGEDLLALGLAYPYDGGKKSVIDWCDDASGSQAISKTKSQQ